MTAASAFAAPVFSNQVPANGSTVTAAPAAISVGISDTANLPAVSVMAVKIDNMVVSAKTLTLTDPKNGTLSFVPDVLAPGLHTVNVTWKSGLTTIASTWAFTLNASIPVDLWVVTPFAGSTVSDVHPAVSITAPASSAAQVASVTFSVDGSAPMTAPYNATTGVAQLEPTALHFADGKAHTIIATVSDAGGVVIGTKTWTFDVARYQASMSVTTLSCIECHPAAELTVKHDMTNCAACHGPSAPLGGTAYTAATTASPHVVTAATSDCQNCHSVAAVNCDVCHNTKPNGQPTHDLSQMAAIHTTTSCSGSDCHSPKLFTTHEGKPCSLCHGAGVSAQVAAAVASGPAGTDCTACHGSGPHTASAVASGNTAICSECHVKGSTNAKAPAASAQVDFTNWTGSAHDFAALANNSGASDQATCVICHDPSHTNVPGGGNPLSYVMSTPVADSQSLCLKCHTTSAPASFATASDLSAFATAGHSSATSCANCHDAHGSQNASLLAYKVPTAFTPVNGTTDDASLFADSEALCYKCHGAGEPARNDVNMNIWVDRKAANIQPHGGTGTHSSTETIASYATNRHAVCADCHDQHKSTAANKLAGVTGVSYASATGLSSYAVGSGTGTTNDF
ncbi:MAG: hypothetical protein FWC54_06075, partial [Actinomycetia bacterium]|nr:hypothetical protein [Actinomycetes bacterium]